MLEEEFSLEQEHPDLESNKGITQEIIDETKEYYLKKNLHSFTCDW